MDDAPYKKNSHKRENMDVVDSICLENFKIIDLNRIDYMEALKLQKSYVADKINQVIDHDMILLLEHPSVFTLGKRGGRENLVVSETFLELRDITVVQTERGGNITYHGPGQMVLYPIVDLEKRKIGVSDFVRMLEEIMIQTAWDFGVAAERNSANHGIWVKNSKIGSIGLSVKRGICFHGLALNVNLDLTPFSWINPCGMAGVTMTSLEKELSHKDTSGDNRACDTDDMMAKVKAKMLHHLKNILNNGHGRSVCHDKT